MNQEWKARGLVTGQAPALTAAEHVITPDGLAVARLVASMFCFVWPIHECPNVPAGKRLIGLPGCRRRSSLLSPDAHHFVLSNPVSLSGALRLGVGANTRHPRPSKTIQGQPRPTMLVSRMNPKKLLPVVTDSQRHHGNKTPLFLQCSLSPSQGAPYPPAPRSISHLFMHAACKGLGTSVHVDMWTVN